MSFWIRSPPPLPSLIPPPSYCSIKNISNLPPAKLFTSVPPSSLHYFHPARPPSTATSCHCSAKERGGQIDVFISLLPPTHTHTGESSSYLPSSLVDLFIPRCLPVSQWGPIMRLCCCSRMCRRWDRKLKPLSTFWTGLTR